MRWGIWTDLWVRECLTPFDPRPRHAKNWPSLIGGIWYDTGTRALPVELRKKGLLVIWDGGQYGHVGLVVSVSEDKKSYTVWDYNFYNTQQPRTKTYYFEGDDRVLGVYPQKLKYKTCVDPIPPRKNKLTSQISRKTISRRSASLLLCAPLITESAIPP